MMKNKKKFIIYGIIILILSLAIEIFVFNMNFFVRGNQTIEISEIVTSNLTTLDNGNYKILDNGAYIRLEDIKQSINKLEFNTDSFNENINIQITYNDTTKTDNINGTDKKSIYINDSVDSIQLSFTDGKGQEIMMNGFQGVNYFQFNPFRFLMVLLFFLLIGVVGFTMFNKGNVKLEGVYLVLVLSFGFLNVIMTPIFYSWDEAEHFIKAYNTASGNLIMREGEVISYPDNAEEFVDKKHQIEYPNYRSYEEFADVTKDLLELSYDDIEMTNYSSTAITYTMAPYLFSSLGVAVGKILNFPFLVSFYLGRFFNLLAYAWLVYFALKIIPIGKKILFICALLPTIVFQAASYSADVVINGFSIFIFALIMKWLFDKKRMTVPDLLIMCSCFIIITASKMTYVPIFLLVLILKHDNFTSRKTEWLTKIGVLMLAALTFIGVFIYGQKLGIAQWTIPGVDLKAQLLQIIYHPINYIGVIIRTFLTQKEALFGSAVASLAYIGYLGRDILIIICFMSILIALIDVDKNSSGLKIRERGIIILMCAATIGLSMTALYVTFTPVGYGTVMGFQGRYLIPLMFPFLFLFQRKVQEFSIKPETVNMIAVIFSVSILFVSIMHVYNLYYL